MKGKSSLMAATAAIGLAMSAGHADAASMTARQQAEMKKEIQDLNDRLNQLQQELQNTQIEQAKTSAAAAQAASTPGKGWFENTEIHGRVYYDLTNIYDKKNGLKQTDTGTSFDIKRFYLSVDHKFNDIFSADVTTDFQYSSSLGSTELYIKKAYLQAKLSDAFILRLGSTDLPWIPFIEGLYGYRYVENTLADRTKFGTSADWGVHVLGSFGPEKLVEYQISAVNGAGYKKPGFGGANRSTVMDFEGRLNVNYMGFTVGVGGYDGKLGKDVEGGPNPTHTATRFDAVAAYHAHGLRAGFEYFSARNWNNVASVTGDKADGYSVFASYQFLPKWSVFGRYDWVNPSRDINSSMQNHYYNFGVSFSPAKIVDFALVYKHDDTNNGYLADSNFPGSTSLSSTAKGDFNEIGLFGAFQF